MMKQYWYLGFLGLIGFIELPSVFAAYQGEVSNWAWSGLLWFLWFEHFIPDKKQGAKRGKEHADVR